jgi:hypothetical protein
VSKAAHNAQPAAELPPADIEAQRRRARRTAILLGALALCIYLAFILATGRRS